MIYFDYNGERYTVTVTQQENVYDVVVREADSRLFVKSFTALGDAGMERVTKQLLTRGLWPIDLITMRMLDYIEQYVAAHNQSPLRKEITLALGLTNEQAQAGLTRLERYRFINWQHQKTRGITLIQRRAER